MLVYVAGAISTSLGLLPPTVNPDLHHPDLCSSPSLELSPRRSACCRLHPILIFFSLRLVLAAAAGAIIASFGLLSRTLVTDFFHSDLCSSQTLELSSLCSGCCGLHSIPIYSPRFVVAAAAGATISPFELLSLKLNLDFFTSSCISHRRWNITTPSRLLSSTLVLDFFTINCVRPRR